VWMINLDPTIGSEIKKTRPAVIVNDNSLGKLPIKISVSITDWKEKYKVAPWMVKLKPNSINGLTKESSADCFQVRSVSQDRFVRRLGALSESLMDDIRVGLSKVLSINME